MELEPLLLLPELLPLLDDPLPDEGMLPDSDELPLDERLPLELLPTPDVLPPDVPPPPLEDPPPPLDEPPPPEELPPPLDDGGPSVLLIDELEGVLDGVAVSVLEDSVSVELGVGVPGSLELGVWLLLLLLRLDVPPPGGCAVVAQTGM